MCLAIKKLSVAPSEAPKEIIKTASKKLKSAPINKERLVAKGNDKVATNRYIVKNITVVIVLINFLFCQYKRFI